MRTLKFIVDGQAIKQDPSCDFTGIVQGTSNYLCAKFAFSEEWNGFVRVAEFRIGRNNETTTPVPIINNKCIVPTEVTAGRTWSVRVVGKRNDAILTTDSTRVTQERR